MASPCFPRIRQFLYVLILPILCLSPMAKAQTLQQDSLALVAIYNNMGGASWTTKTNWLAGPVNTWHGITVSGNRVTEINLLNNNLNGPLRGYKGDVYEGGIRVPGVARWPGKIKSDSVSDHPAAFWDFLPTAAEIAGAQIPADLDGISFLPTFLGEDPRQRKHEYLYWEFATRSRSSQAVRMGDWKAVRLTPTSVTELYNMSTDVGEERNVAARYPDIVARAEALFRSEHTLSQDWPIPELD